MSDQPVLLSSYSALELLAWYKHAGVDLALEEMPVDQFAISRQNAASRTRKNSNNISDRKRVAQNNLDRISGRQLQQMSAAAIPDENVISDARQQAASAQSLEQLREIMSGYKGCNLHLSAKNMVFADGNPQAKIMLVGEAPGRDEDMHGLPFIGRSGQLLDRMLAAIGLDRQDVYISNVIPWRPPGNRTPTPQETEICRPFIERHIELVNPVLLILLGGASAKVLLNSTQGILKMRGHWKKYRMSTHEIDAMPTLHPAYLLRQPAQKKLVWQDLLKIREKLSKS